MSMLASYLRSLELWARFRFRRTLLFSATVYPFVRLFSNEIEARKKRDAILRDEIIRYVDRTSKLKFDDIQGYFAVWGLVEVYLLRLYDYFEVAETDVVYDIGATTGEYSLKCARKGARVLAFELEAHSYEALCQHVKTNGFENQVIPFHCRIDDRANSIDEFVERTEISPTLLKIDIEGDEEKALCGARNTLSRWKPRIILETHSDLLEKNCMALLQAEGYRSAHEIKLTDEAKLIFLQSQPG